MPHQCTNCERVFPDGSKEMLSGCPDCGGNKFQFKPDSSTPSPTLGDDGSDAPSPRTNDGPDAPSSPPADGARTPNGSSVSDDRTTTDDPSTPNAQGSVSPSTTGTRGDTDADYIEAESDPSALEEDTAQADARRDVVTRDELDDAASPPPSADDAARAIPPDSDDPADAPGLDDLRAELNDQFESIKIVEPGQYELNLMELYDRQECIISLQEDGHYVIEVVDTWRDGEP
ncbi:OapC/ArvC family zinc-ribbon domain-containing protein [Haloplanus natans]|uniref:OapC/ArvC family zinc-ribbon domain-containing protein n=1 Tax=Haloplanus natans TaxID=376171 RepID=UPI000677D0D0|nr:Zn-ribbon containing protein [Haloplanus natans]